MKAALVEYEFGAYALIAADQAENVVGGNILHQDVVLDADKIHILHHLEGDAPSLISLPHTPPENVVPAFYEKFIEDNGVALLYVDEVYRISESGELLAVHPDQVDLAGEIRPEMLRRFLVDKQEQAQSAPTFKI